MAKKIFTIEVEVESSMNEWRIMDELRIAIESANNQIKAKVLPLSTSRLVAD